MIINGSLNWFVRMCDEYKTLFGWMVHYIVDLVLKFLHGLRSIDITLLGGGRHSEI